MGQPDGVQRHRAQGRAAAATAELPAVVEQHLFVIVVVVEKRQLHRPRIRFEGARCERAHDEACSHERGVGLRRHVEPVVRWSADVAHIQSHWVEIALPAHRVQRVVGEGDGGDAVAPFDPDFPSPRSILRLEGFVDLGRVEHARVEGHVLAQRPAIRQRIGRAGGFDQQHVGRVDRRNAPHRSTRQHDVVPGFVDEVSVVAEQVAAALVHEQ